MDLYAYTQIGEYENDLKDILPHIPRLRGIRKMSEEEPLSDASYQIERFNSHCGEENVYMIHARIGGANWDSYDGDSITKFPWFIERVDDDFDNTYCDIYVRTVTEGQHADKVYEYKGKKYCETDISSEDETYAGDLYDFFWELRKDGIACDHTFYYSPDNPENQYETAEDLIMNEYSDYSV